MKYSKSLFSLYVAITLCLAPTWGRAATPDSPLHIGHATSVIKSVTGEMSGQPKRRLLQADKVFFKENVITANGSTLVIQFRDGSTFEMGPNGIMTLDEMVFNPYEGTSEKVISLIQGSFRYISGFTSKNSNVTLNTTVATIGIRGSAGSGIVQPGQPVFVSMADGVATVRNDQGETSVEPGESTAIAPGEPPMPPQNLPVEVAAQAMAHISQTLGAPAATVELSAEQKAADAAVNAIPLTAQQQAVATLIAPPLVAPVGTPTDNLPAVPLLAEAASVGLLSGAAATQETPTPEQQAFLTKAAAEVPNAASIVETIVTQEQAQHSQNTQNATAEVVSGATANITSIELVQTLVRSAIAANPTTARSVASAVVRGSIQNTTISNSSALIEAAAQGAVEAAVESGADIGSVTQAITEGIVQGATESSLNVDDAVQTVSSSLVRAGADAGLDADVVTQAVTQGINETNTDASANNTEDNTEDEDEPITLQEQNVSPN